MAAEYAVRCVLYLTDKGQGVLTSRQEIAHNTYIPSKFLAKIAQELARAGIIEIRQGSKGGYSLKQNPVELNMLTVVETMIGEISLNECTTNPASCQASSGCSANTVWTEARNQVRETLRKANFADLSKKGSCCPTLKTINTKMERK